MELHSNDCDGEIATRPKLSSKSLDIEKGLINFGKSFLINYLAVSKDPKRVRSAVVKASTATLSS